MSTRGNFLGNTSMPNYVKLMAAGILASTYVGALAVAVVDTLNNTAMPSIVSFILGTGVSMAVSALGIHQGATLMESTPPAAAPAAQTGGSDNAGTPAA